MHKMSAEHAKLRNFSPGKYTMQHVEDEVFNNLLNLMTGCIGGLDCWLLLDI